MTIQQQLDEMKSMIAEIHAIVIAGQELPPLDGVNLPAYRRAIEELAKGNKKPLELYGKRGGKIPIGGGFK